jgi:hypothetical protein
MAEINVNIDVDVDIEAYDFIRECDSSEIELIIEYLIEEEHIKPKHFSPEEYLDTLDNADVEEVQEWLMQRYNTKCGINHANVLDALNKISTGLLQLTTEEEDTIKALADRLV